MFCPNCGIENQDSAKFCSSCGSQLTQNATQDSAFYLEIEAIPKYFLVDVSVDVLINNHLYASGSVVNGFKIRYPLNQPVNSLVIKHSIRTLNIKQPIAMNNNYRLVLVYSRFWGNYKVGSFDIIK